MQTQPIRVIVRLPYNRPENPIPDPVPVSWTSDKENYLWEVVAKSRGSESGAPDWKALAARLDVPLPYLLYRAQVRYEQDLRGLQVIKGSLSPPNAQGEPQQIEGPPGVGDSPTLLRRSSGTSRRDSLGKLSTSIRLTTPLGVRARLNSLSSNSPSRLNRPSSSSVLTLRGHRRDQTVFRPGTPLSSESETDEEEERQEEAERRLEEQEALDKKLRNLQTLLTGDNVGLVSSTKETRKGKGPQIQRRVSPGSPLQVAGANAGDSGRSSQSISSASSPRGSIPSIPSPPPESLQSLTSRHIAPAKPASSSGATSPPGSKTQPLMRYGPSVKATSGSSTSSFSDLSEASLNSELESAFSSNIRAGGSRLLAMILVLSNTIPPRSSMRLTFVNDFGQTYSVEIDPDMEFENVMALLEAESGIPINEQSISHEGRELNNTKATMRSLGVRDNAMLQLRRKSNVGGSVGGRRAEQDAETIRLQILGDPQLLRQLEETQPEVAAAVRSNPQRFAQLLGELSMRRASIEQQRLVEIGRLNADPFDVDAQRKIEEAIRQEAVLENLEHALEYSPESFGRVTMLYIPVEVNGYPVKAFVDSGAQQTIMSPECAEACGIMRLVDERFSGIARGVGTAKILGRVHSAQLKLSDLFLPCAFTIMEGRDVELLFGLDMLKAHQACIDLEKNVLRIQNREVRFLSEHELPEKSRLEEEEVLGAPVPTAAPPRAPTGGFSGSGRTLGASPAPGPSRPRAPPSSAPARYSERDIRTLMDLGVSREVAISTLDAAGGNVDVAASLLF